MLTIKSDNITKQNIHARDLGKDIDEVILDKLKTKYKGKCYNSALIQDVLSIKQRSRITFTKSRNDDEFGMGDVCVKYETSVYTYNEGDIISGCEIMKINENGILICTSKYATLYIQIDMQKTLMGLKKGDLLPVIVKSVRYPTGQPKITIRAIPYTASNEIIIYKIIDSKSLKNKEPVFDLEQIEIIRKYLEHIDDELNAAKYVDTDNYKYFIEMFYPFKNSFDEYMKKSKPEKYWRFEDIYEICKNMISYVPKTYSKSSKSQKFEESDESDLDNSESEKSEKSEKPKKKRSSKSSKSSKSAKPKTKKGKAEKSSKSEKSEKSAKSEKTEKSSKSKKYDNPFENSYIIRHPIIDKTTSLVYVIDEQFFKSKHNSSKLLDTNIYDIKEVEMPLATVIVNIISDQLNYLRLIRESSEIYNTEKIRNNHKSLWKLYA